MNRPNKYWSDEECNKRTIVEMNARIAELESAIQKHRDSFPDEALEGEAGTMSDPIDNICDELRQKLTAIKDDRLAVADATIRELQAENERLKVALNRCRTLVTFHSSRTAIHDGVIATVDFALKESGE